jgi:hypothetical protein
VEIGELLIFYQIAFLGGLLRVRAEANMKLRGSGGGLAKDGVATPCSGNPHLQYSLRDHFNIE